jgi:DNA-binding IclR family transcriptional regulator
MSAENVKSADRVLLILELLAAAPDGLRVSSVSKALNIPISSCFGLLGTMLNRGFVSYDPTDRTYTATDKLGQLGANGRSAHPLQDAAIRCARQLHRELGIPVAVSQRVGLFIEWAFTLGQTYLQPGSTMPLFKSFNGFAALSNMSESKISGIIDAYNEKFGREIAVQPREVVKRLHAYRGREYISGGPPAFPGVGIICFHLCDAETGEEVLLSLILPRNELTYREPAVVNAVRKCVSARAIGGFA